MDWQVVRKTWTVWLVHFEERIGGKLRFTISIVHCYLDTQTQIVRKVEKKCTNVGSWPSFTNARASDMSEIHPTV